MSPLSSSKSFLDLRAFIHLLEQSGQLVRVSTSVDPVLEVTEIARRLLANQGPAILFEQVKGSHMPLLANLFGTQERVAMAIGRTLPELAQLGSLMAQLKQPQPPTSLADASALLGRLSRVRHMPTRTLTKPPCQEVVLRGDQVNLDRLPMQTCWPNDAGPLLTWPLVITQGPEGGPINIGVYRMQKLSRNRLIMRWLKHRGGAQHARAYAKEIPVAVAIGCDPGTLLAAVTPIPETLSEYAFAGLLREKRVDTAPALTVPLPVPAYAEIILEGTVNLQDLAPEGPFGDHTGYYNEVEPFPVFTVHCMTMRRHPIYLSTYTGRPPDEPAMLALALNHIFVPLLRQQFPEIAHFHLNMAACSYRLAVVSLHKGYPGHAFRVMAGIWGFLRQFLYTKVIVVVDAEVPVDNWEAVAQAIASHVHSQRDLQILGNTPIDYLDFASPLPGLGGKMGIDATRKLGPEQQAAPPMAPLQQQASWQERLKEMLPNLLDLHCLANGRMAVARIHKSNDAEAVHIANTILQQVPPGAGADQLWLVDQEIDPSAWNDLLWAWVTRADPSRDLILDKETGRFVIDATHKLNSQRVWGTPLRMDPATSAQVSERWLHYPLPKQWQALPPGD
ncbi:MAG: UbiD family decarboxylase [Magnetococcales bacterium]|nr:UbiD family decarboxylase [Magnetococcales bacterium]MBF0114446.1 UbiD family decarboxylase [Magnetococcales bacterium]